MDRFLNATPHSVSSLVFKVVICVPTYKMRLIHFE